MHFEDPSVKKLFREAVTLSEKQSAQSPKKISAKMKTRIVQRLMCGENLNHIKPGLRAIGFSL